LWLHLLIFTAIGLSWCYVVLRAVAHSYSVKKRERRALLGLLGFVVLGAVGLELTLLIQPGIQAWYSDLVSFSFSTANTRNLVLGMGFVLISGLLQEFLKGMPLWGWWSSRGEESKTREENSLKLIGYAASIGLGFGLWEAVRLVAVPLAAVGSPAFLPVHERFWAIGFHVLTPVIMAHYLVRGSGPVGYVIAALLHTALNYPAVLQSFWVVDMITTQALIAVVVVLTALVLWFGLRE
jgi:hypothetical protein